MDALVAIVVGLVLLDQLALLDQPGLADRAATPAPGALACPLAAGTIAVLATGCLALIGLLAPALATPGGPATVVLAVLALGWTGVARTLPGAARHDPVRLALPAAVLGAAALATAPGAGPVALLLRATMAAVLYIALAATFGPVARRLAAGDTPGPLRGPALAVITGGILALALGAVAGVLPG